MFDGHLYLITFRGRVNKEEEDIFSGGRGLVMKTRLIELRLNFGSFFIPENICTIRNVQYKLSLNILYQSLYPGDTKKSVPSSEANKSVTNLVECTVSLNAGGA